MNFNSIPFVAVITALVGGGGGGSLTIVQQPAGIEDWGNQAERSLTAVGSGNHLLVAFRCATAAGTPTISDSAGGSWAGTLVHSYAETSSNSTTYYYIRSNITSGLTWVRANTTGSDEYRIAVIEVSGGTPVLDGAVIGAVVSSLTDPWNINFTTTQANAIFMGMSVFSNNTTITDTAPIDADPGPSYFGYFRGQFATAGSNTAVIDLSDSRTGSYSGIVVKGS